jgi:pyruvate/2-oxoglutarate/acetoin dehydrogenase E1 component/TPP-dependent pyruvate/acetoin dehydrogenase alpha subunit
MLDDSYANDTTLSSKDFTDPNLSPDKETILNDYEICCISREASLLARKEVLTGKAKFGIIGDGKEVPQVAMAKAFRKGDFRAGYYRDQTLMFALGLSTVEAFFAQLYADAENDPFSGGRQMNSHFATPLIDQHDDWVDHRARYNISSDVSNTAGQMARSLGLALASKKYREIETLSEGTPFSHNGDEVCFCTIGDASTSEGIFWETINAAGVMQVPLVISIWDDGYGISVPVEYQTTKGSISEALHGLQSEEAHTGIDIYVVKGWDYPELVRTYVEAIGKSRRTHKPALIHVTELTQPQGHSTSGSHERYKSKERLKWEHKHDCLLRMEEWILKEDIATEEETKSIRINAKKYVKECRDRAWKAFNHSTKRRIKELQAIYKSLPQDHPEIQTLQKELQSMMQPLLSEVTQNARRLYYVLLDIETPVRDQLRKWLDDIEQMTRERYHSYLYSEGPYSALRVPVVRPRYEEEAPLKNGYEILNAFFDKILERDPSIIAFGEDVGKIGDVNQGFAGMQKKYGEHRVFDTGIREWTIMGQAIGMALRGLRPIAEIQYLDYLIYGLEPLMDDLATLRWRSKGIQKAPAIIRTRGHRLEGIWHAGSPLGMILNSLRGIYVLVPRNMVQAAGMYNTVLQSDDPALIIECLNGYRLKERMPGNIGEYTVPLGAPEVLREGKDITLVTYGSCVRVVEKGSDLLEKRGISVEIIDVQTLLPFDLEQRILESLKKTSRILFIDEDVPGGASAYMMRQVLEVQNGYRFLDSPPATLSARSHRTPYGSDGDYFTKPNPEDVFEKVFEIIYEAEPSRFRNRL